MEGLFYLEVFESWVNSTLVEPKTNWNGAKFKNQAHPAFWRPHSLEALQSHTAYEYMEGNQETPSTAYMGSVCTYSVGHWIKSPPWGRTRSQPSPCTKVWTFLSKVKPSLGPVMVWTFVTKKVASGCPFTFIDTMQNFFIDQSNLYGGHGQVWVLTIQHATD